MIVLRYVYLCLCTHAASSPTRKKHQHAPTSRTCITKTNHDVTPTTPNIYNIVWLAQHASRGLRIKKRTKLESLNARRRATQKKGKTNRLDMKETTVVCTAKYEPTEKHLLCESSPDDASYWHHDHAHRGPCHHPTAPMSAKAYSKQRPSPLHCLNLTGQAEQPKQNHDHQPSLPLNPKTKSSMYVIHHIT